MKYLKKKILWIRGGESAKRILRRNPYLRVILIDGNPLNQLRSYVDFFFCCETGKENDVDYILSKVFPMLWDRFEISFCFTRSAYYIPNKIVQEINNLIGDISFFSTDISFLFRKDKWWNKLHKRIKCVERFDLSMMDSLCFPCVLKKSIGEESKNVWFIGNKKELLILLKKLNIGNDFRDYFIEPYYESEVIGVSWLYIENRIFPLAIYRKDFAIVEDKFLFRGYTFKKKFLLFLEELINKLSIITYSLNLQTGFFSAEFVLVNKEFALLDLGIQCDMKIDSILESVYHPYSILLEFLHHGLDLDSRLLSLVFDSYLSLEGFYHI